MLKGTRYAIYWKEREGIGVHSSGSFHSTREEEAAAMYNLLLGAKVSEGYLTDFADDDYRKMSLQPTDPEQEVKVFSIENTKSPKEENK